jgi:hypothetical protein
MVPQVPQQQEQELVVGTIQGIIQKGQDKWQVAVQPDGSQYTRNLWSSDPALIGQLSMMIQSRQSFLCRVSHWTGQDGGPRRSLWIQGVGPEAAQAQPQSMAGAVAQAQAAQAAQPQVSAPMHAGVRVSDDERENRIHRQTASKVATILLSHLPAEQRTFDSVIVISERLVAYYAHGAHPATALTPTNPYFDGDPGPQGVPHGDDDIPF